MLLFFLTGQDRSQEDRLLVGTVLVIDTRDNLKAALVTGPENGQSGHVMVLDPDPRPNLPNVGSIPWKSHEAAQKKTLH